MYHRIRYFAVIGVKRSFGGGGAGGGLHGSEEGGWHIRKDKKGG